MEKKYCKLIMISSLNNNKYYEMIYEGGSDFTVNYGRVEHTKTTIQKPYSQWQSIYREKVKKGYKDVTELVSVSVTEKKQPKNEFQPISDKKLNDFIQLMRQYTDGLVSKTYSVKCDQVSPKQIKEAQSLLDQISKIDKKDTQSLNDKLMELYTIIPRYMTNVRNHLIPSISDLDKHLEKEQDNLDAMSSQVSIHQDESKDEENESKEHTFLDALGLTASEIDFKKEKDIKYLIDQLSHNKIKAVFQVNKDKENKIYDSWVDKQNNKSSRFLIHGTRCTSVIPILREGLKIRPTGNFQFSGKAYGEGCYFSEVTSKSLNYTGYDNDKVLLVYEVHTGNPFVYNGWYRGNSFPLDYKELSKRGYDSTYVKAGGGLLNSEIIVYTENQYKIKYIIWLNK